MFEETIKNIGKALLSAWDSIKRIISNINETQEDIEKKKRYRKSWVVPYDTRRKSQVPKNIVPIVKIRNNI